MGKILVRGVCVVLLGTKGGSVVEVGVRLL